MNKTTMMCALWLPVASLALFTTPGLSIADDLEVDQPGLNEQAQVPPQVAARMAGRPSGGGGGSELPPWDAISTDFTRVVSTTDGAPPMYNLWIRDRDGQVLAELPRNFESQRLFIAYTITGGIPTAGVQFGDMYAQWKRYDRRLALIQPNVAVRTTGDRESELGHGRVFTDRVVLDIPIAGQGPNGGLVINMTDLLVGQGTNFFGRVLAGANRNLVKIDTAKAFPRNIEVGFELPLSGGGRGTASGQLTSIHYSISVLPENTGYRPRVADNRVGYFTTTFRDIGDPSKDTPWVRYINRWHLEKADPSLRMSPPREPIVFYLEHTTPVRYRRWVREGVLEWNKAFEKVGILNAIEVYQQDARTGAHMDKDPADARYNFILWTNANIGFAIGPSRVDPRTGQILDADVVLDEGFITSWARAWQQLIPEMAMEGFGPETYAWLENNPQWDPRVRLAAPAQREDVIRTIQAQRQATAAGRGIHRFGGHPAAMAAINSQNGQLMGAQQYDGLTGRVSQVNGMCMNAMTKSLDVALMRLSPELLRELADRDWSAEREVVIAGDDPVSGTWSGTVSVPEMGDLDVSLNLTLSGTSVSGSVNSMVGSIAVSGDFDAASGRLTLRGSDPNTPQLGEFVFNLTVDGENMSGSVTGGGQRFEISLTRTVRPTPAAEPSRPARTAARSNDDDDDKDADEEEVVAEQVETTRPQRAGRQPRQPVEPRSDLDGMPEEFVGPLLRDLTMHEVGHVLGLRHNFKASGIYTLEEINSPDFAGKAMTGSVMDYNPININMGDGEVQGPYGMMTIGPYDYWAIEYGYSFERDLKPILSRVSNPQLAYATDEDTWGPDPLARRFDLGKNPLDYADSQMRLVRELRGKLIDRVVKDGDNWSKARRGYEILLSRQFGAASIAANWIGGSNINRDHKGDPGDRLPIETIDADQQRRALNFVIDNIFKDDAFGLSEDLLSRMTVDKWWDDGGMNQIFEDQTWPVHDRIQGLQAATLTMLMNPTTLNRVYDNEFRVDASADYITLPEVLFTVSDAVWAELDRNPSRNYTARQPMISSLRRNLQSEHLQRLIDLSMPNPGMGAASKPVSNLSVFKLRDLKTKIDRRLANASRLDPYTLAHLDEARTRIERALDAQFIYNTNNFNMGGGMPFILLQESDQQH